MEREAEGLEVLTHYYLKTKNSTGQTSLDNVVGMF